MLERFAGNTEGVYECRIATIHGQPLFDDQVRSEMSLEMLEVLRQAIVLSRPSNKTAVRSIFTVSKSVGLEDSVKSLSHEHDAYVTTLDLCIRILAPNSRSLVPDLALSRQGGILDLCFPDKPFRKLEAWSPRDFYDNVHVPSKAVDPNIPVAKELDCQLYPFQKRAVEWLLRREGNAKVSSISLTSKELPYGFVRVVDADGRPCFLSRSLGILTTDETMIKSSYAVPRGGILAEEMGLGKTVEMIALICLHRQLGSPESGDVSSQQLPRSPATLIITPPAILQQWKNELQTLAPSLKVLIYEGVRVEAEKSDHDALVRHCCCHDVVLTTYNVLGKEIHYAATPDRSLRHVKKYEKRLSPLTQLLWWRVVLDEAQMVESGVSNAAKVANLIPRENAWCVSGTSVKKDARDLFGLLVFLRYEPICHLPQLWDRLITRHRSVFKQIFRDLALRHTKDQIKDDIQLPVQKRVVISVPFTQIEEQHYTTMFQEMAEDCGLDRNGGPLKEDWDPDSPAVIEKMRIWLTRLRQTCLHPEVGSRNRRALGGKGPLRTVAEVLEVMIEQNDAGARTEERTLMLSQIRRGQILEHAHKSEEALQIWLATLEEAKILVNDCRAHLKSEVDRLRFTEKSAEEEVILARTGPHRQRLRAVLEIEHMCIFFTANAYFQIKTKENITRSKGSDRSEEVDPTDNSTAEATKSDLYRDLERKEETAYDTAKLLRRELLVEARNKVDSVIHKINEKVRDRSFVHIPAINSLEHRGGIESRSAFEKLTNLLAVMQSQTKQLAIWREKTIQMLTIPLVDEESDKQGDENLQGIEYETSTKQQDEVYVYVDALRALTSDRHDIMTGQNNTLVEHEMKIALKEAEAGNGHSPQLLRELLNLRQKLKPSKKVGSLRGLLSELRELKSTLKGAIDRNNSRAAAEHVIINSALQKLQQIYAGQTKALTGMDRENELFRDTMNARLEYYRQLQAISDTVAPYEEDLTEEARHAVLSDKLAAEANLKSRIATLKSKGRYLVHLREEASDVETNRLCIICTSSFENGILTSCGHSYCIDCLRIWWGSHRNCPTCKKHLTRNDFHQITYRPQELTMEEENNHPKEKSLNVTKHAEGAAIYSGIREPILNQIKNIDLDGSFGSKIDTLARHMLWIREHDPGAKSIVFSQYRDFLDVLARAFKQFKIGFTGIDRKDGIQKFKNDSSMECFFLHAKAHSSGLNLVNATHVFLCEPLINTAIELQAIARVHRIGQHHETTVWMYLVEDTVEKSIYDISVQRRLSHMGQVNKTSETSATSEAALENQIEAANTLELEQIPLSHLLTKGSGGGEMVQQDDLWNCLFQKKSGQSGRVAQNAERAVARHLGADAAEARMEEVEAATSDVFP